MQIIISVLAIMLPIFLGYFFKLTKIFNRSDINSIRKFVVTVTVPFIIFKNLYTSNMETLSQLIPLSASFVVMTIFFSFSGNLASRFLSSKNKEQNAYLFSVFMGNYGYLGWGVMAYFFGQAGFTRAVFFSMLFWPVFLIFGFGLEFLSKSNTRRSKKKILEILLKNASVPIGVSILAIILNVIGISINKIVWDLIVKFAAITIPAILFTIGLDFQLKLDLNHLKLILAGSAHRVFFGFLIGLLTLVISEVIFNLDPISKQVILMQSIMPTAILSTFFATYVKLDEKIQSGIITFSNLLSLLTIPTAFYLVKTFFS
ncbi:MAG: AEC family transporter [Myxococcota bacterium]